MNIGRKWLFALLLTACSAPPIVKGSDTERIIVTNSRLVGREAAAQDVAVNVLIVDGKLSVVTKDELVVKPGDVALDANGGFLFGRLALGARPSFVILDNDPRENVDVLLDTKKHARFAIREGVIVKNELRAIADSTPEAASKPRLWKAYTPPPIAVPIRGIRHINGMLRVDPLAGCVDRTCRPVEVSIC